MDPVAASYRESSIDSEPGDLRVVLLGNPNTGKTTLFNRLCGLRHKTSNFPGTTQDARVGVVTIDPEQLHPQRDGGTGVPPVSRRSDSPLKSIARGTNTVDEIHIIDLPGIYSLELDQSESEICRRVLAGDLMPRGEPGGSPEAACVVLDATNLARNLVLAGEVLRRRLPTVVVLNMIDLARRSGLRIDVDLLAERLACRVVPTCARTGEGLDELVRALPAAGIPSVTPPGSREGLERWADELFAEVAGGAETDRAATTSAATSIDAAASTQSDEGQHTQAGRPGISGGSGPRFAPRRASITDRLDHILVHPILGTAAFLAVMAGLFFVIFKIAVFPMGWIETIFVHLGDGVRSILPPGMVQDLAADGIVAGISGVVVFLPQICLLFFLISLLEDTGYLARAALLMDRLLRPFGLPGHAFVPLLSSHACALPGIMSTRGIPDRRERLATILIAPFMSCSARVPVYVLLTTILFPAKPLLAALAFIGCYALGIIAGLVTAIIFRRTLLRGESRRMVLELPTYKVPSLRTALLTTYDRAMTFLKGAGTVILAICIVLWWMGSFPKVEPPPRADEIRRLAAAEQADRAFAQGPVTLAAADGHPAVTIASVEEAEALAESITASDATARSYMGRLGRFVQPVFQPLGYDWQLTIAVMTSFAAREVFGATMAVIVTGTEDFEDQGVVEQLKQAKRTDGITPIFTPATAWSLLVFYVLAMQCLPTLAVTAREAGGFKWALLQLGWMTALAYAAALMLHQALRATGML
jgi:ferrous iron transport protein B